MASAAACARHAGRGCRLTGACAGALPRAAAAVGRSGRSFRVAGGLRVRGGAARGTSTAAAAQEVGGEAPEPLRAVLPRFAGRDLRLKPGQYQEIDFAMSMNPSLGSLFRLVLSGRFGSTAEHFATMEDLEVPLHSARALQARAGLEPRAFLDRYGFLLLPHRTTLTAEDWVSSTESWENEAKGRYHQEVKELVKDLFPELRGTEGNGMLMRRGPGSNSTYATGVHQDLAFTDEDYAWVVGDAWREKFQNPAVSGFMLLCFWRPIRPMEGSVRKTPLALCDPRSVRLEDVVPRLTFGEGADKGIRELGLKANDDQRWYFYPEVHVDEVIIFKQFLYFKSQNGRRELNTCFHTAFEDPTAPADAEERCSSEYRLGLWF